MSLIGDALQRVLSAFDQLEVRYAVGGSVASSLRGNYRQTNDVDLVVEMRSDQVNEFVRLLGPDFYADPDALISAFRQGRPYNVIHLRTAFKFDLFPATEDRQSFSFSELGRRTFEEVDFLGDKIELAVVTAEDALLAKLRWYRLGGESSEKQWRDITGIVAIQGARLDQSYLHRWANELGVADLLNRALS